MEFKETKANTTSKTFLTRFSHKPSNKKFSVKSYMKKRFKCRFCEISFPRHSFHLLFPHEESHKQKGSPEKNRTQKIYRTEKESPKTNHDPVKSQVKNHTQNYSHTQEKSNNFNRIQKESSKTNHAQKKNHTQKNSHIQVKSPTIAFVQEEKHPLDKNRKALEIPSANNKKLRRYAYKKKKKALLRVSRAHEGIKNKKWEMHTSENQRHAFMKSLASSNRESDMHSFDKSIRQSSISEANHFTENCELRMHLFNAYRQTLLEAPDINEIIDYEEFYIEGLHDQEQILGEHPFNNKRKTLLETPSPKIAINKKKSRRFVKRKKKSALSGTNSSVYKDHALRKNPIKNTYEEKVELAMQSFDEQRKALGVSKANPFTENDKLRTHLFHADVRTLTSELYEIRDYEKSNYKRFHNQSQIIKELPFDNERKTLLKTPLMHKVIQKKKPRRRAKRKKKVALLRNPALNKNVINKQLETHFSDNLDTALVKSPVENTFDQNVELSMQSFDVRRTLLKTPATRLNLNNKKSKKHSFELKRKTLLQTPDYQKNAIYDTPTTSTIVENAELKANYFSVPKKALLETPVKNETMYNYELKITPFNYQRNTLLEAPVTNQMMEIDDLKEHPFDYTNDGLLESPIKYDEFKALPFNHHRNVAVKRIRELEVYSFVHQRNTLLRNSISDRAVVNEKLGVYPSDCQRSSLLTTSAIYPRKNEVLDVPCFEKQRKTLLESPNKNYVAKDEALKTHLFDYKRKGLLKTPAIHVKEKEELEMPAFEKKALLKALSGNQILENEMEYSSVFQKPALLGSPTANLMVKNADLGRFEKQRKVLLKAPVLSQVLENETGQPFEFRKSALLETYITNQFVENADLRDHSFEKQSKALIKVPIVNRAFENDIDYSHDFQRPALLKAPTENQFIDTPCKGVHSFEKQRKTLLKAPVVNQNLENDIDYPRDFQRPALLGTPTENQLVENPGVHSFEKRRKALLDAPFVNQALENDIDHSSDFQKPALLGASSTSNLNYHSDFQRSALLGAPTTSYLDYPLDFQRPTLLGVPSIHAESRFYPDFKKSAWLRTPFTNQFVENEELQRHYFKEQRKVLLESPRSLVVKNTELRAHPYQKNALLESPVQSSRFGNREDVYWNNMHKRHY